MRLLSLVAVALAPAAGAVAHAQRPPVIDVHVHSGEEVRKVLARHDSLNVRFAVVSVLGTALSSWAAAGTDRFQLGLLFPCEHGRMPNTGTPCFDQGGDFPDVDWLRTQLQSGRISVLGELVPQYVGMTPNDPRLEPYWSLAEELDIPAAIHMGPGPPAAAYPASPVPYKSPNYRMAYGDPLLLEEILLRHKQLRVYVMHAGWPRLESMLALLYAHPNVYVDIGVLQYDVVMPKDAYLRYLRGLVESGFDKRVMFGSDFSSLQALGIDIIREADFLSSGQKADILCGNAARFFRLRPGICDP